MSSSATIRFCFALAGLFLQTQISRANPADFTVNSVTSTNVFKLSEAKGKFVALHFLLKTECPYCLRHTRDYVQKSADDSRVVHVFLKPDTDEEIKAWAIKRGIMHCLSVELVAVWNVVTLRQRGIEIAIDVQFERIIAEFDRPRLGLFVRIWF